MNESPNFNTRLQQILSHFDLSQLDQNLVYVTHNDINILGKSFQDTLIVPDYETKSIFSRQDIDEFLTVISSRALRLNHVGVNYFVNDLDKEVKVIKTLSSNKGFRVYEEESGNQNQRWIFVGDVNNWEKPLCEFVLYKKSAFNFWTPHFQIDIDTVLSRDEILCLIRKYLGPDFVKWELDIPNYGVVLVMGVLEKVKGIKIVFGIGTNLRDTKQHREEGLKNLSA